MMDTARALQESIRSQLSKSNLEVIGIQPIPHHTDRMVRLNTLQEMLEDFDGSPTDSVGYILQVKTGVAPEIGTPQAEPEVNAPNESIFLSDGKPNEPYLVQNADLLFKAGDYGLARSIYKTVLQSGAKSSPILCKIAKCFELEGKLEEARSTYEEAITFSPSLECYQHLANILTRQSKDSQAAEVLERALHLQEITTALKFEIYKSCGNSWTRAKQFEAAEANYNSALDISPSSDDVRSNLGALYLQIGKFEEAKRCFRDATASNPKNHMALTGLGSCALADGDKALAIDYFSQSLKIELNNPTAILYIVKCAFEIKSYARACNILEEYIQIVPVNSSLLYSLGGLQFHLGKFNEARGTVLKILELQPQHPGAKELLTLIQKYAGAST